MSPMYLAAGLAITLGLSAACTGAVEAAALAAGAAPPEGATESVVPGFTLLHDGDQRLAVFPELAPGSIVGLGPDGGLNLLVTSGGPKVRGEMTAAEERLAEEILRLLVEENQVVCDLLRASIDAGAVVRHTDALVARMEAEAMHATDPDGSWTVRIVDGGYVPCRAADFREFPEIAERIFVQERLAMELGIDFAGCLTYFAEG